jgi:ABC-type molybdate transport system substrate-binding protein
LSRIAASPPSIQTIRQDLIMTHMPVRSGAIGEIRVLSAGAMAEIVRDLGDAFERAGGGKVAAEFS